LQRRIRYVIRMEQRGPERRGDARGGQGFLPGFGLALVQVLRSLGLAARFVSGYLIQLKPT